MSAGYRYRANDGPREAEVQAKLAALRARLEGKPQLAVVPEMRDLPPQLFGPRCEDCGYRADAHGHLTECGQPDR